MCSPGCSPVRTLYFSILCLLVCINHSHQEENLSVATRDHDHAKGNTVEDSSEKCDPNHTNCSTPDFTVWLAASGAIFSISLCGIFGVLIIPIMQKIFYQHLIQFLVALAVGTLSGDALLHLLPHALLSGIPDITDEQAEVYEAQAAWKGFFALITLVIFFLLERVINMLGEWKESQKRINNKDKKVHIVRSGHKTSDKAVGERLCKHKYSSYCVSDIDVKKLNVVPPMPLQTLAEGAEETFRAEECELITSTNSESSSSWKKATSKKNALEATDPDTYDTVFIRDHEHSHHGHSHAHSHLHSKPDSISSVAWMVLFGDGIHNLADGVAIGAAFTLGYVQGVATSIAILCHELPHEIGDFAMLLKAGMSVKQAIFYNLLSSVLAYIGMVIGILLGHVEHFSSWILCGTAGIFLYVALVDMIPELNSGHSHPFSSEEQTESHCLELILQLLGMITGIVIMLLFALYEHDLKTAFLHV